MINFGEEIKRLLIEESTPWMTNDKLFDYIIDMWQNKVVKICCATVPFRKLLIGYCVDNCRMTLISLLKWIFGENSYVFESTSNKSYCSTSYVIPLKDEKTFLVQCNKDTIETVSQHLQVSAEAVLNSKLSRSDATKLALSKSIDFSESDEETIIKLANSERIPFFLMCGSKTHREISEEALDEIINGDYFFSDKMAPHMGQEYYTIAEQNIFQTMRYQKNISLQSLSKMLEYASKNRQVLERLQRIGKSISLKFKNADDEFQLLLNLYDIN